MTDCTPRELRIIADHVERLTKARVVNQQLGVPTTPDELAVNFPNGYTGIVRWTPGITSATPAEHRAVARNTRHRDAYLLDLATVTATAAVKYGPVLRVSHEKLSDELTVNFPNGYTGTVRWAPRLTSTTPVERQAIARSARHRDAYLLDPGTLQRTREPRATRSPHLSVGTPAANATAALTALQAGARSQAARTTEHGARQHPA